MSTPDWHGYAEELDYIEESLRKLNEHKSEIFKTVRELHGRVVAGGLKTALRVRRMTAEKREHIEQVDAEAAEILFALEQPRPSRARAPAREKPKPPVVDEPFNPETGELEDRASEIRDGAKASVAFEPPSVVADAVTTEAPPVAVEVRDAPFETEVPKSRPEGETAKSAPHIATPATAKTSDQEPSEAEGSGEAQDRSSESASPPTPPPTNVRPIAAHLAVNPVTGAPAGVPLPDNLRRTA